MKVALVYILLHASYVLTDPVGQKAPGNVYEEEFTGAVANVVSAVFAELKGQDAKFTAENTACEKTVKEAGEKCNTCAKSKCKKILYFLKVVGQDALKYSIMLPGKWIGAKIKDIAISFKSIMKDTGVKLKKGFEKEFKVRKMQFLKALQGLKNIGIKFKKMGIKSWNFFKNGFNFVKNFLKDVFSKRRRRRRAVIDSKVRRCFETECRSLCDAFLDDTTAQDKICGPELSKNTDKYLENVHDLKIITLAINNKAPLLENIWFIERTDEVTGYAARIEGNYPILTSASKLEFPPRTANKTTVNAFWGMLAEDYYAHYARAIVRPETMKTIDPTFDSTQH